MKIEILHGIDGAKKAHGLVVVIDVFRAMTVECYCYASNASSVIPVGDISTALRLKETLNSPVLIGERHGIKIDGFNFGNSPSEIENTYFEGKTIIHTTSAGTMGIENALNADEIVAGSLVNAKATAMYIKEKNPDTLSLVCMGLDGKYPTEEDIVCAEYIKSLIENTYYPLDEKIENLKLTDGKKFFDKTLNNIFPEKDFFLSTQYDKFNFVLKVEKKNGLNICKKIEIN